MQYSVVHLTYNFKESWQQDIFEQAMCDLGFEVFDQSDAYIQTIILSDIQKEVEALIKKTEGVELLGIEECEDHNWNAAWEAEHEIEKLPMEVRITPHCAFGAGHHETTSMMINAILKAQEQGQIDANYSVLDMGCGTGVLAIMAKKCGAGRVVAVDIDDKSVKNSIENAEDNNVRIDVRQGNIPPEETFDLILANIHRNILIEHMPYYAKNLKADGEIWMSGFYEQDIAHIVEAARKVHLKHIATEQCNEWCMIKVTKKI